MLPERPSGYRAPKRISCCNNDCSVIGGEYSKNQCDDCPPPPLEPEHAACFWCFPTIVDSDPTVLDGFGFRGTVAPNVAPSPGNTEFVAQVAGSSQAPFRSVFSVSADKAAALNNAVGYVEGSPTLTPRLNAKDIGITLSAGLDPDGYSLSRTSNMVYYDETNTTAFVPNNIGALTGFPENRVEVLRANVYRNLDNRDVNFRCYYVGSYQHTTDKPKAKENCLKRYGYTGAAELTSCLLCDPVNYRILPTPDAFTDNVIEPYQDKIKGGLYAPFPPLWGRITYNWDKTTCNPARQEYRRHTYNLNLFTDSNIKSIVTAFLLKTGKGWLNQFLSEYDLYELGKENPKNESLWS
jgi:hypothetical protein